MENDSEPKSVEGRDQPSRLRLHVHDFRSIKNAEIVLDGITVVTGINGCGKSTLSKLLYHTFYVTNHFERIVLEDAARSLYWAGRIVSSLRRKDLADRSSIFTVSADMQTIDSLESLERYYTAPLKALLDNHTPEDAATRRLQMAMADVLEISYPAKERTELHQKPFREIVELVLEKVQTTVNASREMIATRNLSILRDALPEVFHENIPFENFSLYEQDTSITDHPGARLCPSFYVEKVAYIDTPMIAGMYFREQDMAFSHWGHLNRLLRTPRDTEARGTSLARYIQSQVIHGTVAYQNDVSGLFTYRPDKSDIAHDLRVCATGIKSMGILQILLENGFLDETSLLIIDEPEAHLHPDWVVQYARILVQLHKTLGVRLFIATHDSKMVNSLRSIAETEIGLDHVNFYLAEPTRDEPPLYEFLALRDATGKIHKEFNRAYELLDTYCEEDSEEENTESEKNTARAG